MSGVKGQPDYDLYRMNVISCSKSVPVASNRYKAGRAQNRRIALEMLQQAGYDNPNKNPVKTGVLLGSPAFTPAFTQSLRADAHLCPLLHQIEQFRHIGIFHADATV